MDFDPGPGEILKTSVDGTDLFALELSSDGAFVAVTTLGGTGNDGGLLIAGPEGAIHFAGYLQQAGLRIDSSASWLSLNPISEHAPYNDEMLGILGSWPASGL